MGTAAQPGLNQETALKRYDAILRYLAYENTVYWTRSQFFLFANVGLLGFAANKFPADRAAITQNVTIALEALMTVGFLLAVLWLIILQRAEIWIHRWEALCIQLEPAAFGDQYLWRNPPETALKSIVRIVAYLFLVVWLIAGLWLACIAGSRLTP